MLFRSLADRICVLQAGHKMQYDTPDAIYNRPAALFVAGFTGAPPMNLVDCTVNTGRADLGGVQLTLPARLQGRQGNAKLGIRPENLRLAAAAGDQAVPATVSLLEPLGSETLATLQIGKTEMVARLSASFREAPGTPVMLHLATDHLHLFDAASGNALD